MTNSTQSVVGGAGGAGSGAGGETRYRWTLLRAARFKLDAGSMFGLIPRSVWSRTVPIDDRGRMTLQHNCLLLERDGPGKGPKLVIIEVGTGDKLDPKSREIFDLEQRSIVDALQEADCRPEDIGAAVVSHLHFDHAGGLTRLCRAGETPDWSVAKAPPGCVDRVKLTFPNASVHTQRREWEDALANKSVMTRTYFRDHLDPIAERVVLAESPLPFSPGLTPGRDELPASQAERRMTEVVPGVSVFLAPGHTWGQQGVAFTDVAGRRVVFTPDVMPTAWHAGAAYSLAYDVEPYTSMVTRRWLLTEAAAGGWVLVLDHEPGNPVFTVAANGQGWFDLVPVG